MKGSELTHLSTHSLCAVINYLDPVMMLTFFISLLLTCYRFDISPRSKSQMTEAHIYVVQCWICGWKISTYATFPVCRCTVHIEHIFYYIYRFSRQHSVSCKQYSFFVCSAWKENDWKIKYELSKTYHTIPACRIVVRKIMNIFWI